MNSTDLLNYSISIGFLVITGAVVYTAFKVGRTLDNLQYSINSLDQTIRSFKIAKESLKYGAFSILGSMLGKFTFGGDKYGKR